MAQKIPLEAIPNQSFSLVIGDNSFVIRLVTTPDSLVCDVTINDVVVITGLRVVGGSPLIPFRYQEKGNFIFFNNCQC